MTFVGDLAALQAKLLELETKLLGLEARQDAAIEKAERMLALIEKRELYLTDWLGALDGAGLAARREDDARRDAALEQLNELVAKLEAIVRGDAV